MQPGPDVVLFLGAGISAPSPTRAPMFAEIRDACAERVGVRTTNWSADDPRRALLNNVVPEVFLTALTDAGFELDEALSAAVSGGVDAEPNAGHRLAARVVHAGGMVWTTNWDGWIELAHQDLYGTPVTRAIHRLDPPPSGPQLAKVHGSVTHPDTLQFRTSEIIKPIAADWGDALRASTRGKVLFVVGYAGADVDLFPALVDAAREARACYWFEGSGSKKVQDDPLAEYEQWRFDLQSVVFDPSDLPSAGRHLVWCGAGSTATDPSRAILDAFEDPTPAGTPAPWEQRYALVQAQMTRVRSSDLTLGRRMLLEANFRERLADRRGAAGRNLGALAVGNIRERVKALRSLRNLTVLRSARLRSAASRAYALVPIPGDDAEFVRRHGGQMTHDPARAARVASGTDEVSIDGALNTAVETRWSGDLEIAETIAHSALGRLSALDLDKKDRDWPERVSRASYEHAQALLWQGKYDAADDVCRSGLMRVSGAKWIAWEFSIRAAVRFVHGDYVKAADYFAECETLLEAEGFADFGIAVATGRAAAARLSGDLATARQHYRRAEGWPRKGPGMRAAVLAEGAELALAEHNFVEARDKWRDLTEMPIPLFAGLAHMRLAELGHERDDNIHHALAAFSKASSAWGKIRTSALRDGLDVDRVASEADGLGPIEVFLPDGPWLI